MKIYTDGACRGNPGIAAIGIVILDQGKIIAEHKECIGKATNNRAEYRAIIKALELGTKFTKKVSIFSDSELVVRQLSGKYKIKADKLRALATLVKEQEKFYDEVTYTHRPRTNEFIQRADELANEALDREY